MIVPQPRRPAAPTAALAVAVVLSAALGSMSAVAEWDVGVEGGSVIRDGGSATRLRLFASNDERPLTQYVHAEWLSHEGGNGYRVGYLPRFWLDERLYLYRASRITFAADDSEAIDDSQASVGFVYGF